MKNRPLILEIIHEIEDALAMPEPERWKRYGTDGLQHLLARLIDLIGEEG